MTAIRAGTDGDGVLHCPACGATIATVRTVTRPRGGQEFIIGRRWLLAPGFVFARDRHASGLPWYKRGTTGRPGPELRFDAFVATCGCGAEVEAPAGSPMLIDTGERRRRVRKA